jgi:hypothetical protein
MLDECNMPYVTDPKNIMAYGNRTCRQYFTNGQGSRMRALIQQESILINITAPDIILTNTSHNAGNEMYLARDNCSTFGTVNNTGSAKVLYKAANVIFSQGTTLLPSIGGYTWAKPNTSCQ